MSFILGYISHALSHSGTGWEIAHFLIFSWPISFRHRHGHGHNKHWASFNLLKWFRLQWSDYITQITKITSIHSSAVLLFLMQIKPEPERSSKVIILTEMKIPASFANCCVSPNLFFLSFCGTQKIYCIQIRKSVGSKTTVCSVSLTFFANRQSKQTFFTCVLAQQDEFMFLNFLKRLRIRLMMQFPLRYSKVLGWFCQI